MRNRNHTKMPSGRDIPLLLLGIIGIGTSGPVIALSAMPIISLIFWRNLGGALIMAPFALRNGQWLKKENRVGLAWSMAAGFVLALHFMGFFIAMRFTTVAAGTALTALQPIFAAYFVKRLGGHIPRRAWVGMVISFVGVLIITGVDFQISNRAFLGDIAAIVCAALAALYVLLGSKAQQNLATSTYTTLCYFTCALTALPIALVSGVQLLGFEAKQWWLLFALILGAQILGHTMFNFSLKRVSPAIVSLIVFFEVPVSALLAFWWLDQLPPLGTVPGLVLLLAGCAIFVTRSKEAEKG
ncbi:MAG: DMT family transporter [Actinobacteria bacterium]|nr:DMT family transporter [Actinomycetota bacterium]